MTSKPGLGGDAVALVKEERFFRSPDGRLWSRWGTGPHTWAPFLEVFDKVLLVARVKNVESAPVGATLASHERMEVCPVTYFQGPWEYLQRLPSVHRDLRRWASMGVPLVLRIPSPLANALYGYLRRARRPFAVEVVADPFDMMAPGAMRHPLRPVFRHHYTECQRHLCQSARSVKYVTRAALQRRYPADRSATVHAISDVFLPEAAYRPGGRRPGSGPLRLVFVGMLEQLYKAPDVLIRAVAQGIRQGTPLHLKIIGDGGYRTFLAGLAGELGIASSVQFLGACDREAIQDAFDDSDLFVLPSRQEGLPRAMLEAMAHGLPCIGTEVGGIPELLERNFMVQPNRVDELASRLTALAADRSSLAIASQRNLAVAREYRLEVRTALETAFARDVRRLCS